MRSIRIAVVDADELSRQGINMFLSDVSAWRVTGLFATVDEFEASMEDNPVTVIFLSDRLPRTLDLWALLDDWLARLPSLRIVILSHNLNTRYIQRLFQCSVHGYIYRPECTRETLFACIKIVIDNQQYVSPCASAELYRRDADARTFGLHCTDIDVLNCLYQGLNTHEIAHRLDVNERTVYRSRNRLRRVLDVRINEQIIPEALRRGLIELDG